MPTDEIAAQISDMINRLLPELETAVTVSTRFDDLGIDSLQKVDLLTEAEDTFHIKVDDDELENILAVGDLVRFVAERVS
jgi:acyl carrier protein